MVIDFEEGF